MSKLSNADITTAREELQRVGYAVLPGVVPADQLAEFSHHLTAEYERAQADGGLFEGGGSYSGHLNCFPGERSKFAYEAIREHGVFEIIDEFAGDDADRLRVTTNYNLPGSGIQHFHPDGLYTEAFLICNVAVVDTDLDNGAIDMIPGTHHRFYKFWRYTLERKWRASKRLPMKQGDVLLRISTVWHRGMPNHTDTARPMLSFTFGETSAPESDPFAIHDGEVSFTPNWYGTDRLSQIREKVFVSMPWLYSSSRFARSLIGNKGYSSW